MKFDYNCYTMVKNKGRVTKLYNRAKFKEFSEELEKIDWEKELSDKNDINTNWNSFLSTMRRLEDIFIPTKTREKDNKHKFPLDKETRELIKKKNSLSKKVVISRDPDIRKQYNRVRNRVKKEVDKMRKKFELELVSEKAKTNPKAIWSYIKSKSKTREEIGDLHLNPEDTNSEKTDDNKKTKANILSDFASVFTSETEEQIPELGKLNIITEMEDIVVDEETVLKHLAKLKVDKSPGLDKLHPRLLVEVRNEIKNHLVYSSISQLIVNHYLMTGKMHR